jgi:hypothetical protein
MVSRVSSFAIGIALLIAALGVMSQIPGAYEVWSSPLSAALVSALLAPGCIVLEAAFSGEFRSSTAFLLCRTLLINCLLWNCVIWLGLATGPNPDFRNERWLPIMTFFISLSLGMWGWRMIRRWIFGSGKGGGGKGVRREKERTHKGSELLSRKAIRPTLSPGVNGSNARHIRS